VDGSPLDKPRRGGWRGPLDDEACAAWQTAMLVAGATEQDCDVLAVWSTSCCGSSRTPNAAHPIARNLIKRIAEHVVCTSVRVRIGRGDENEAVEFPDRPLIH
jgi:hypothetical protein